MKSIIALCLLAVVAVAVARPETKYTSKYDNINLEEILKNHRLLEGYIKCMLEKGKCPPEGKELRSHIKEALEEDCAKCTDAQRAGTRTVIGHLINHEDEFWRLLKAKYDPESKYSGKYEQDLRILKQ